MEKKNDNKYEFLEEFRKSLPIYQYHDELLKVVKENLFCIVTGDTGSGKTTQIPQYLIESLTKNDFNFESLKQTISINNINNNDDIIEPNKVQKQKLEDLKKELLQLKANKLLQQKNQTEDEKKIQLNNFDNKNKFDVNDLVDNLNDNEDRDNYDALKLYGDELRDEAFYNYINEEEKHANKQVKDLKIDPSTDIITTNAQLQPDKLIDKKDSPLAENINKSTESKIDTNNLNAEKLKNIDNNKSNIEKNTITNNLNKENNSILTTTILPSKLTNKINSKSAARVVITQPRRVAAIQMAKRVSYEKGFKLGEEIGYSIRFEDYSSDKTLIKYVTDGILVRECLSDQNLSKYNVIILDEAHERSLYTDILFALCKKAVLNRNGNLRLIVTSATLDTKQFSKYFKDCPVFSIHGRCYPVDKIYYASRMEKRVENSVKTAIRIHLHEGPGHILAFLTGFEECEQACKICFQKLQELESKGKKVPPMIIMPLYGAQNTDEQSTVFEKAPENCRKLIFSTNIAETSLTVDGIAYVIDCGYVKQKIFNPRTSMDSLTIIPISKVQAVQRAGRAGRTGPGKCIRLYTEQFFETQMPKITVPEILRVNLSSTILTLKSMGIENVLEFDFMERPEKESILEALKILYFLQAIDKDGKITKLGQEMAKFPIDCCFSRVLIASKFFGIMDEICTLVSLISTENVWFNVNKYDEDRRANFDLKKSEFIDKHSDHMGLLNIYKEWEFHNFQEDWCKANFLHFRALKQSRNIKEQIKQYMDKVKFEDCEKYFNQKSINILIKEVDKNRELDDYEKINVLVRMSLCQGFFMNAARKLPLANEGLSFMKIIDGSVVQLDANSAIALKDTRPDLVLFTELGGSNTKALMKQVSVIELKWISDLVGLIKNVDVFRLRGKRDSPQNSLLIKNYRENIVNNIDLATLLKRPYVNKSEFEEDDGRQDEIVKIEEAQKLKSRADEAKERYLQRKTNRNKSS